MFRTFAIACLLGAAVLMAVPSSAAASDFSGLVWVALSIIAAVVVVCLAGGYITSRLMLGRRSWSATIGSTLGFATIWFAVGWIVASFFGF